MSFILVDIIPDNFSIDSFNQGPFQRLLTKSGENPNFATFTVRKWYGMFKGVKPVGTKSQVNPIFF